MWCEDASKLQSVHAVSDECLRLCCWLVSVVTAVLHQNFWWWHNYWKRKCSVILLQRTQNGHHESVQRWNRPKGNFGETSKRQQHSRELISSQNITQEQQQRPESPTLTLTWHACKHKVHKLHQRSIFILFSSKRQLGGAHKGYTDCLSTILKGSDENTSHRPPLWQRGWGWQTGFSWKNWSWAVGQMDTVSPEEANTNYCRLSELSMMFVVHTLTFYYINPTKLYEGNVPSSLCVCVGVRLHAHTHAWVCVCMSVCVHVCVYACVCTHVCFVWQMHAGQPPVNVHCCRLNAGFMPAGAIVNEQRHETHQLTIIIFLFKFKSTQQIERHLESY